MALTSSAVLDETVTPARQSDDVREALIALWPHFLWAGLFSSGINLLYLSSPLYLMQVYNRVLLNENISTLVLLTLILAIALLTMALLDSVRAWILIRCGLRLDEELSRRVFEALVVRAAERGASRGAQQLRNLDQFRTFVTGPGIYFAFDLPWIPIYLMLLFFIHPLLGIVATLGAILLLGLAGLNEVLTREPMKQAEAAGNQSYIFTENVLRHADVIRAMGMQPAVERNWQSQRSSMLVQQAYASDKNAIMTSSIRFFRLLLQSLMLGTGAWLAIDHAIAPATIFAASIVMGRALVPVEQAVGTWKQFIGAREAYVEVRDLLTAIDLTPPHTIVPRIRNTIDMRDVTCSLPARPEPVIKGVSFELKGGQALGIVGASGSGKSTLARMLVGAIAPAGGRLRFGGLDYAHWDPLEFGRNVGYLPQDVGLFAGTVRENIARFGDASTEEIIDAAKRAGIHEMILDLPRQYDTRLGASGVGLSGGQRQRLALARALLGRPPLLVLDEPNANLDAPGEEALKAALLQAKSEGATVIVITHRTTILDIVDVMMVLRNGLLDMLGPPGEIYHALQQQAAARGAA
ncbi:MAG TPA: type I secretion system permease/ATPase [Bradyrhizobium sp.]|uniref:type I secretion system permease/ATPase n=1 Tax=Bradyrhizobium sp. TaxID=376 RepID=UPI002C0D9BF0|nr:type I secretion system permease/ATPase [Bradyrhizobium sp.]HLZ06706.1 type I secretion system permease/ATPase [Bradyrhizobium sp.]